MIVIFFKKQKKKLHSFFKSKPQSFAIASQINQLGLCFFVLVFEQKCFVVVAVQFCNS